MDLVNPSVYYSMYEQKKRPKTQEDSFEYDKLVKVGVMEYENEKKGRDNNNYFFKKTPTSATTNTIRYQDKYTYRGQAYTIEERQDKVTNAPFGLGARKTTNTFDTVQTNQYDNNFSSQNNDNYNNQNERNYQYDGHQPSAGKKTSSDITPNYVNKNSLQERHANKAGSLFARQPNNTNYDQQVNKSKLDDYYAEN